MIMYLFDICFQGLNTKKGFDVKIAAEVSKIIGLEFVTAPNKVKASPQVCICSSTKFNISLKRWRPMMLLLKRTVLLMFWHVR